MSSFTKPLIVEVLDLPIKDKPFVIAAPFTFESDVLGRSIDVPVGYRTDFASIPQFFWRILPPLGRHGKAAVVHDLLCDESPHTCGYLTACEVFDEAMKVLSVKSWKRKIMAWAVRNFGPRFDEGDVKSGGAA